MLSRLDLRGFTGDLRREFAPLEAIADTKAEAVREIIDAVRSGGDDALRELTQRFDGGAIDDVQVPKSEVDAALERIPAELRRALEYARGEITAYHEAQVASDVALDRDGVLLRELVVPIDRVGCYVPGGRASYPSTVLMTAVPARIAGVPEVVLCSPPGADGRLSDTTLAAAALAGVDAVYRVGGVQAIAAMAYGTESIAAVDLIVGPGNAYVALAKQAVAGVVGIESFAGPSELAVVADERASAQLVAADLLAQAEHGPDGVAVLVTWAEPLADAVDAAILELLADAPRRTDIEAAFTAGGRTVLVDGPEQALRVVNTIAPEHLELLTADPEALVREVRNAGAVFCGPWAPAVVGDYVAGVNHVLPTARTARFASALRVDDFRKYIHVVSLDEAALKRVAPHIEQLTAAEGLAEHGRSVALRAQPS